MEDTGVLWNPQNQDKVTLLPPQGEKKELKDSQTFAGQQKSDRNQILMQEFSFVVVISHAQRLINYSDVKLRWKKIGNLFSLFLDQHSLTTHSWHIRFVRFARKLSLYSQTYAESRGRRAHITGDFNVCEATLKREKTRSKSPRVSVGICFGALSFAGPFAPAAHRVSHGISRAMDGEALASDTKAQRVAINKEGSSFFFFQPIAFAVICTLWRSPLPVPPLFQTFFFF